MIKKGFTLVEMSIVLVIMGIMLGLGVQGKSLIESVRYNKEWNTIRNIAIGLEIYNAANNGELPTTRISYFKTIDIEKYKRFMDFTDDDFKSIIIPNLEYLPLFLSIRDIGDYFRDTLNAAEYDSENPVIGTPIPGVYSVYQVNPFRGQMDVRYIPVPFLCRLDKRFDDNNLFAGKVRLYLGTDRGAPELNPLVDDCDEYRDPIRYLDQDFAVSFSQ